MLRLGNTCRKCQKQTSACRKCTGCDAVWYCSKECKEDDWDRHKLACRQSRDADSDITPYPKCQCCGWGMPDMKRCSGCHVVNYCSRDCQIQDWKEHKATCKKTQQNIQIEPNVKDKEPPKTGSCESCKKPGCKLHCSKCKDTFYCSKECQKKDWDVHKKTKCKGSNDGGSQSNTDQTKTDNFTFTITDGPRPATFQMIQGTGLRPPEVTRVVVNRPPGSLEKAKAIIRRRFFLMPIVDDLTEVEVEHPFPFMRGLQAEQTGNLFVAFMFQYHPYAVRHAIYIKDRNDEVTKVEFYLDFDNPFPFFSYSQVRPGNYICLMNPLMHRFMDGTVGIRIDDPSDVTIIDGKSVT